MDDPAQFLDEMTQALTADDPGEAQDRFAAFIEDHADDPAAVAPVMALIERLDAIRRPVAIGAAVAVALNAPPESALEKAGLEKWDSLIERIAATDIFRALDWAVLPALYSDESTSLNSDGAAKWCALVERAALADPQRALRHARDMEHSDPTHAFATVAKLSADLIESQIEKPGASPPRPPAPL